MDSCFKYVTVLDECCCCWVKSFNAVTSAAVTVKFALFKLQWAVLFLQGALLYEHSTSAFKQRDQPLSTRPLSCASTLPPTTIQPSSSWWALGEDGNINRHFTTQTSSLHEHDESLRSLQFLCNQSTSSLRSQRSVPAPTSLLSLHLTISWQNIEGKCRGWWQRCENVTLWAINKEVWLWLGEPFFLWDLFCCAAAFFGFFSNVHIFGGCVHNNSEKHVSYVYTCEKHNFLIHLYPVTQESLSHKLHTPSLIQFVFYFLRLYTVLSITPSINTSFDTPIKQNRPLWRCSFPLK